MEYWAMQYAKYVTVTAPQTLADQTKNTAGDEAAAVLESAKPKVKKAKQIVIGGLEAKCR